MDEFQRKTIEELGFIRGQLSEALPGMKDDIATLKIDVGDLKSDSVFKKGKTAGISALTSVAIMIIGWFIHK